MPKKRHVDIRFTPKEAHDLLGVLKGNPMAMQWDNRVLFVHAIETQLLHITNGVDE